jgi:phage terminase large subunit-like protein
VYTFDERAADLACAFFEKALVHSKGEWAGQPFRLENWQRTIVRDVFGWKRADGTRRYRTVYIEIPRKNGKSTLASGLGLLLLYLDNEPGAEIYSAAADREQAAIVFSEAKNMVNASAQLSKRAQVMKNAIFLPQELSVYRVLSSDAYTKHGLNAHGIIFDELHAQPDRELLDVLATSTGARRQPLTIMITTAGYDRLSVCWEQHEYARQVRDGIIQDDTFYSAIYAADETDEWLDEQVWYKANPGLGATVKIEYLREQAVKAKNTPAYQNTFRRLHLNQWTQQESRWMDMHEWDACGETSVSAKLMEGAACYGGLDMASTYDVAAFVLDFPSDDERELHTWLPFFWLPEENLVERSTRDRVPYDAWARDGLIRVTPGNVIDYGRIVTDIADLAEVYNIREIAFDRWGAYQITQQLEGLGLTMVGFGQGFASMSTPTRELMRLVLDRKLRHGAHPILRWMADNLVVQQDAAGNIKPAKNKSREKIDGMVAGIMALDRASRHLNAGSIYNERGVMSL